MTDFLHFHFSFSCVGEGNGNPLQCSCLGNPRNGAAWWACRLWGHTESDTTEATQQQQHSWKHRHTVGYYVNYLAAFSQLKVIPEVHNLLYHWDGKFLHRQLSVSHLKAFSGEFYQGMLYSQERLPRQGIFDFLFLTHNLKKNDKILSSRIHSSLQIYLGSILTGIRFVSFLAPLEFAQDPIL